MLLDVRRRSLLRWYSGFFLGNVFLIWLIGLEYLQATPWITTTYFSVPAKILLTTFLGLSYVGQLALVAFIPACIIVPLILLWPSRFLVFMIAIVLASSCALWISVDTILYHLYHFHINGVMLSLTLNGLTENMFGLSLTEMLLVGLFTMLLLGLEWFYANILWRYIKKNLFIFTYFKWIFLFFCLSLYISYSMIFYSINYRMSRFFIDCARFLPLYYEVIGAFLPEKHGFITISRANETAVNQPPKAQLPLNYPSKSVVCNTKTKKQNIVIIAIDAWRFDMLNKAVTPNITAFSDSAWIFKEHSSGGNSTGPGIFSLFYSIPATYWTAMEKQKKGPLFIDTLLRENYEIQIFGSADLSAPPFDRTVFQAVPHLEKKQSALTPNERDKEITEKFKSFVKTRTKKNQPFFSFLFYDSAHGFCIGNEKGPFQPVTKECMRFSLSNKRDIALYFNRYKNALHYIDGEVADVIQTLKENHLLESTVVLITGDHGEEFDDNHLGYWGHAGNFTRYQVQTPMILYFPKEKPKTFTYHTSHFDVVPTLMTRVLGCEKDVSSYSVGTNLLDARQRPYLIVGSYIDFGIVEPERITTIFPTGYVAIEKKDGQDVSGAEVNYPVLEKVLKEMRRFYQV